MTRRRAASFRPRAVFRALGAIAVGAVALPASVAVASTGQIPDGVCIAAPYDANGTPREQRLSAIVGEVRRVLADLPMLLRPLLETAPEICLSEALVVEKAYFDPSANRIVLADDMSEGLTLAVLVHELRHAEQSARGICPSDDLSMRSFARATLALEADASTVAVLVAWQRRESGDPRLWRAVENWPMTSDIAVRFGLVMAETADVVLAAAEAFDQWYALEERRARYYVASCSGYLDRQDADHALPRYRPLMADYFETLCVLPDGAEYPCAERP